MSAAPSHGSNDELRRIRREIDQDHRASLKPMHELLRAAPQALTGELGRRRFLTVGGFSVSMTAVLAACARGPADPPIPVGGSVPVTTALATNSVDDVVLLRTASSLEHNAIDTYTAALPALSGGAADLAKMFQAHHAEHADAFEKATEAAGGEAYTKANPVVLEKVLGPALGLIGESGDKVGDLLRLAHALETLAAGTYQALVPSLTQPALRRAAMAVGAVEARHAAALAAALEGAIFDDGSAATASTVAGSDPVVALFQVPGSFGSLSSVPVVLNKTQLAIDIPGPNSFMY